ncbi:hypothetical protein SH661x_000496 [Planctomicrobium sp. SH661]|uniref:tetratricopeptide repeat protein n=1 Tax=Planctomicrobium sp. SH661 TaxID=3448124 RepID=UPI003F5AE417
MRRILFLSALLIGYSVPAMATEPVLQFLEGLRGRGYYDIATYYLEQMEADPDIAAEVKAILPYERGQTLLQSAKVLTNLEAQRQQLDMAQAAFEAFVKAEPNHQLTGRANTARGQILLERARVDIWDGDKPSNEGNRENFRESARKKIAAAREIFEEARKQHEANWKKFPAFIPEDQTRERAERNEAEELFIRAQLDLAQCTYWEAQTYDKGSKQRIDTLRKAAGEFEAIHQQYRSQLGGLFARIWQGKCFEEQGDTEGIRIALGIYGEILEHDGTTGTMRNLKDRALRFRLICLNYPERHDYQLVIQEAENWLKEARDRARTDVGMGIQWELCRAQEALGMDRNTTDTVRRGLQTQALNRARAINRFPGELKNPSSAMIQRLMVAMNRDPSDPKDFDAAYGNGNTLYDQVTATNANIRKLQDEGKQKEALEQHQSLMATAAEMARMYDLALRLATPAHDPILVNVARLRLSYGYLLQQRYFDAAVVADDQMTRFADKFPEVAKEAGFLAMTAFDNAYATAPEGDRKFETEQVIQAANKICERWPDSDRANDARNTVAKIYWNDGDLLTAAEWWEKIPPGTKQYGDAQVRAGKAYWRQYVLATANNKGDEPANPEDLNKWKQEAIEHLTIGLEDAEKNTPADRSLSDDLVGAKLTLVSIRNLDGLYQSDGNGPRGALDLLLKDPHPVLKAVDVAENETRPKDPGKAKSRQMASFAYQQLLRSWVGLKNLDEARKARLALEQVAGGGDEAALTQVFVDFGRELEQELSRLKASGDTRRLEDVRAGFESFLNDLFQRKDGQSFYSLLWIAETYSSLADASEDNPAKAVEFYNRAATAYRTIITMAASDPKFANPQQLLACKLRLANCLREQKQYGEAETVLVEVLRATPNAPDAQFQAAELYEDWGASGGENDRDKFKIALYGKKDPVHVWGWTYAAQSLQQAVYSDPGGRLDQLLFDARYRLAEAERKFGLSLTDPKESKEHLVRARASITGFQRVSKRWTDEEYQRFNSLYKLALADLGEPVVDLPRQLSDTEKHEEVADNNTPNPTPSVNQTTNATPAKPAAAAPPPPRNNTLLIVVMLALTAGAVAGIYFMTVNQGKKKKTPKPKSDADDAAAFPASTGPIPSFDAPADFIPPKPVAVKKTKAAPAAQAFPSFGDFSAPPAGTATTKPVTARPAAAKPPVAKPAAAPRPAGTTKPAGTPAAARPATASPAPGNPAAATRPAAGPKPPGSVPTAKPRPATPAPPGATAPNKTAPRPGEERKPAVPRPPGPKPPEAT